MFKHLLVPLDGSHLAEAALPAAACLAEHLDASITLIHIIERDVSGEIHGEHHLTTPAEANAYLEAVARARCRLTFTWNVTSTLSAPPICRRASWITLKSSRPT